ncbi:MAG: protein kinase [Gammaproteobacteria bacterium]|nr:protein kinase [Gammaproteobacteria bacterium]
MINQYEPIEVELNPHQLVTLRDQQLMLALLMLGEQHLEIKESLAMTDDAIALFKSGCAQGELGELIASVIEMGSALSSLMKVVVRKGILQEHGPSLIELSEKFRATLVNLPQNSRAERFEALTQFEIGLNALEAKLSLLDNKSASVNYTRLTPQTIYTISIKDPASSMQEQCYKVKLPHHFLFLRRKGEGKTGVVYEVLNKLEPVLGQGTYAIVKKLAGKVKQGYPIITYIQYGKDTINEYVIKSFHPEHRYASIQEWNMSKHAPHIHCKPPLFGKKIGHLITQYFPDINIFDLSCEATALPESFILDTALKLVQAYKLQLFNQGIVHRDIKSDNILVRWIATGQNFVDLNLSQRAPKLFAHGSGTPAYISPEVLTSSVQEASSDIYGLALVLCEIICYQSSLSNDFSRSLDQIQELILAIIPVKHKIEGLSHLIQNLKFILLEAMNETGLDPKIQTELFGIIAAMLQVDPKKRPSIDTLITKFNNLNTQYLSPNFPSDLYDKAIELREKLIDIEQQSNLRNLEISNRSQNELSHSTLPITNQKENEIAPLSALKKLLVEDGCMQVEASFLPAFLQNLGLSSLQNSATLEEVTKRVEEIIANFFQQMEELLILSERLYSLKPTVDKHPLISGIDSLEQFNYLMRDVDEVFGKHSKYSLTLDNLLPLTQSITKRLAILSANVDHFETTIQGHLDNIFKLKTIRKNIIATLNDYVAESDTTWNHLFHKKAFSADKKNLINNVIDICEKAGNVDELSSGVRSALQNNSASGVFPKSKNPIEEKLVSALNLETTNLLGCDRVSLQTYLG